MNNKTTALIASTLFTALLASSSVMAGQASITPVTESAPISAALEAELFPTDSPIYTGVTADRVNFSMESNSISAELEAELFTDHNR